MTVTVTTHALERWRERIDPTATMDGARLAIIGYAPIIERAAAYGCRTVILGCGGKLCLDGARVVTVLGKRDWSRNSLTPIATPEHMEQPHERA